ncbi:hypothetical protein [Virgibacillus salexigens]|uniref:P27 family phage terminase small subunit n=1 Tax=Virgibacillus kapii TaxID=1638645 RepID=A0ABQ2DDX4_9BACI|nr:hypothetical protein [Virgibacillus kapii]GGJ51077.1 hypothetical protein GCM10007111_11630 [Virgibacillus kapii]
MAKKPSAKNQQELIEKEIDRLNTIFLGLPDSKREVAKELIERIAFMTIQLEILEDTIKTKGPTYMYQNGSQRMLIENPAQKSYNTTMNRYTAAYAKLFDLLAYLDNDKDIKVDGNDEDFEEV